MVANVLGMQLRTHSIKKVRGPAWSVCSCVFGVDEMADGRMDGRTDGDGLTRCSRTSTPTCPAVGSTLAAILSSAQTRMSSGRYEKVVMD